MFEEFISKHPIIADFFDKSLKHSKLARAYLFTGNAKPDKLLLIKELNKILNCERNTELFNDKSNDNAQGDSLFAGLSDVTLGSASLNKSYSFLPACNECQNCKWIQNEEHPKTPIVLKSNYEADKDKKNNEILLAEADEDQKSKKDGKRKKDIIPIKLVGALLASLADSSESFRIIVIENVSYKVLEKESANALLKSIEEAKLRTMFILLAESKDIVMPTIVSRCQIINFNSCETKEYPEEILVMTQDLIAKMQSDNFKNKLEQMRIAEEFAEKEAEDLLQILSLFQDEIMNNVAADYARQSELVFEIENAINDLKQFVRPKAVLTQLFSKI
jgi:DNA polymerase III gamma/tau subunit